MHTEHALICFQQHNYLLWPMATISHVPYVYLRLILKTFKLNYA